MFNAVRLQKPSLEMYDLAFKTLKEHPYKKIDKDSRNLDAEYAKKEIEDYLDELGWEWDVQIKNNLQPRMAVGPEKMSINKNGTFSDIDLQGLKAHEIKGHVGRRYYALKTGLYLFVEGLLWRNTLDEGLAVWNSLNLVDTQKPKILLNGASEITLKDIEEYKIARDIIRQSQEEVLELENGIRAREERIEELNQKGRNLVIKINETEEELQLLNETYNESLEDLKNIIKTNKILEEIQIDDELEI